MRAAHTRLWAGAILIFGVLDLITTLGILITLHNTHVIVRLVTPL